MMKLFKTRMKKITFNNEQLSITHKIISRTNHAVDDTHRKTANVFPKGSLSPGPRSSIKFQFFLRALGKKLIWICFSDVPLSEIIGSDLNFMMCHFVFGQIYFAFDNMYKNLITIESGSVRILISSENRAHSINLKLVFRLQIFFHKQGEIC